MNSQIETRRLDLSLLFYFPMKFNLRQMLFIAFWALILGASSPSYGQVLNNFAENVRQSYAWGITDNKALTRGDLEAIAQAVLVKTTDFTQEQAAERVKELSDSGLRKVSIQSFLVDYVEIPLADLEKRGDARTLVSQFMGEETSRSPIRFRKNGQNFIRWFIHPLRKDLSFLKEIGNPLIQKGQFLGQMTESRSLLLMDRGSADYWTIKLSLPVAVGPFRDKTYYSHQGEIQFKSSEQLLEQKSKGVYKETNFLHEQEAFSFKSKGLDEAQLVRSIKPHFVNGQYLLSFSAIMSYGLGRFVTFQSQEDALRQEKKWLSIEPGIAAANIYAGDGIILNSNHSQNSTLVLSAEKVPLSYKRRDMDFDLDLKNYPESKYRNFLAPKNLRTSGVSYSMTNGFAAHQSYYQGSLRPIVETFFISFIERYRSVRTKPLDPLTKFKIVKIQNEEYFFLNAQAPDSSQNLQGEYRIAQTKSFVVLQRLYPELKNYQEQPSETMAKLLLNQKQRFGGANDYGSLIVFLFPEETTLAWDKLRVEFMDPSTRAQSVIGQTLKYSSFESFSSVAILAGKLYKPEHEDFIKILISESAKVGFERSLELAFAEMKKTTFKTVHLKKASDMPADYWRLLAVYRSQTQQGLATLMAADYKLMPTFTIRTCRSIFQ